MVGIDAHQESIIPWQFLLEFGPHLVGQGQGGIEIALEELLESGQVLETEANTEQTELASAAPLTSPRPKPRPRRPSWPAAKPARSTVSRRP